MNITHTNQFKVIKQAYTSYKQEKEDVEWSKLALANAGLTVEDVIRERVAHTYNKTAEMISLGMVVLMFVAAFVLYI